MDVIQFKDVWEMYRIKFIIEGKSSWENFWALKEVSFKVKKGETLGIIGENGAGKSTILKLIMDMLTPDKGEIEVKGRVCGLLELGAGFQPELTGRENIYLNAGLFGLTHSQIDAKYEEIVNFASLGKFINAPAKCYSQGMFVRLAFSIAIYADPDVLLIDDTLAVGDEFFQRKCIKKVFELKEQGKTIVFVTHDMSMLSRLCKRAILLKEGSIVKDGAVDNVIPLYTQMVGEKTGVGSLEKKPLNLVFNNGRLFLNWQDKLLTPNPGAYTSFSIVDKWYSSPQAEWEVKKEDGNKLIARGIFYQLALTQVWRIEITDDYKIKLDIEIDSQEPLEIQEGYTNLMLNNEYTNWFTGLEKGKFPPIDYKDKNWQSVFAGNIPTRCIGTEENNTLNGKLPTLIFKQFNAACTTSARILNTDYLTNCRLLQYRALRLQNYSATQSNHLLYFSGEIALDIPDVDSYLNNLEDEFILTNGRLKLFFDNGRCIFCCDSIDLTKANHINTAIYTDGRWYFSRLASWDIKKHGKNKIIATGNWPNLPLIQIWEVEITGEYSFSWKLDIQVNQGLDIEQQYFYILGCKDYTHWFSKYGLGKFPDSFLETDMDMVQRCIPGGEIGLMSQDGSLPGLSLRFSDEYHNFAKILNSNFYNKARILRIEKVEAEKNSKFSPGRYPCFKLDIALDRNKRTCTPDLNILQGKKLKLVFDNGAGRIFWEGREFTKRLGLYTSLRSQGRWYDSASSAVWRIEKNDNIIKAFGEWLHLPIEQFWEIRLQDDNVIELNIKMKVKDKIEVDRLQTNLMLSENYSEYIRDRQRYHFPVFKDDIDDDWDIIYSDKNGVGHIGATSDINQNDGSQFPMVILFPEKLNNDHCLNIINSDIYHRGRVLQYLDANKKILPASDCVYFNGKIIIGGSSY